VLMTYNTSIRKISTCVTITLINVNTMKESLVFTFMHFSIGSVHIVDQVSIIIVAFNIYTIVGNINNSSTVYRYQCSALWQVFGTPTFNFVLVL